MRTFKLEVALDTRVVVPEEFTESMLLAAAQEETTNAFLTEALEQFDGDPEGFTLHILKHGIRRKVREALKELFEESGLGGTLSPARVLPIDVEPAPAPEGEPVSTAVIAEVIPA